MSRTRGAAVIAANLKEAGTPPDSMGGNESLTYENCGIMTPRILAEMTEEAPQRAEQPEPPPAIYACDPTTLDRNMEASELAEILAMILGGWSLQLGGDKWSNLRPDVRRHFKRVG